MMTESRGGSIALMGSGELAESMAKVHRQLMSSVEAPIRAVFIDTPAGFEVNIDEISAKAIEYFDQRFSLKLAVASYKSSARASSSEVERAVRRIEGANYIFAGPGSPTYAVRNWQNSPVWEAVRGRLAEGAAVVLASAAAISISRLALPVYEIYKAGEDPRWNPGLDLLGAYGLDLVVIPHWNNTEGGEYDTRYCFMGQARFQALEQQLPEPTTVIGIDEYTACIVDLRRDECRVMGAGEVTVRRAGRAEIFPAGASFKLDHLRSSLTLRARATLEGPAEPPLLDAAQALQEQVAKARAAFAAADPVWSIADAAGALYDLAGALDRAREAGVDSSVIDPARVAMRDLGLELGERAVNGEMTLANAGPFVELLVSVRAKLREAKEYALADQVRDGLAKLGVLLEDTPTGTVWKKAERK